MSAVLEETKSAKLSAAHPRPQAKQTTPQEPTCPISPHLLQQYVDSVARNLTLPTVNAQAPPLEEYVNQEGVKKMRPISACRIDAEGNVVPFSGPVVPDDFADDLWEKCKSHVEQIVHKALWNMADSIIQTGEIHERSKVLPHIPGRFIIVDDR